MIQDGQKIDILIGMAKNLKAAAHVFLLDR